MFDKSFLPFVLARDCSGTTAIERANVADEVAAHCLQAPEWIPAGNQPCRSTRGTFHQLFTGANDA